MNIRSALVRTQPAGWVIALVGVISVSPLVAAPADLPNAPASKIYVVANQGGSQITAEGKIVVPAPKDAFHAQGSQIGTKPKGSLTLVFSNGTGAFFDADTRVEVKRFTQGTFTASRTDLEREPSASQTEVLVAEGTLAISSSKLAASSVMTFLTPLGSFNLRDGNLVVQAGGTAAKYFLLAGEGTVHGGPLDLGGKVVHAGEQALILPGSPGQPNSVQITKIAPGDLERLVALTDRAYAARKTVFFETDAGEITPVPVVPESLPVEAAISPSKLPN